MGEVPTLLLLPGGLGDWLGCPGGGDIPAWYLPLSM